MRPDSALLILGIVLAGVVAAYAIVSAWILHDMRVKTDNAYARYQRDVARINARHR